MSMSKITSDRDLHSLTVRTLHIHQHDVRPDAAAGIYTYARLGFGRFAGFQMAWAYWLCNIFGNVAYAVLLMDALVQEGLLLPEEPAQVRWGTGEDRVDFGLLYHERTRLLKIAHSRFTETVEYREFVRDNSLWLEDYALFMAIKGQTGGKSWYEWEQGLKFRDPDAIWKKRQELRGEIQFFCFVQYMR